MSRDWINLDHGRSMRQIAEAVGEQSGLTLAQLRTLTRRKAISHPRQDAMARMKAVGFSHHQIVRFFGLKDHTSSVHACHAVKARAEGKHVREMMAKRPRSNNAARNARIIVLLAQALTYQEIAGRVGVSRGVVAGVVNRHGAALADREAA